MWKTKTVPRFSECFIILIHCQTVVQFIQRLYILLWSFYTVRFKWNTNYRKPQRGENASWNPVGNVSVSSSCADSLLEPRAECTTTKADCSPTVRTCVTVWMWTVWAASTPAPTAAHASVGSSAAATGSGFTSRWRWRVERSSGTSLLFRGLLGYKNLISPWIQLHVRLMDNKRLWCFF